MKIVYLLLVLFLVSCTAEIDFEKFNGTYESPLNESGSYFAELTIENSGNNKFDFEITTGTADGCTGYIKGAASTIRQDSAFYSGDECVKLVFTFAEDTLLIKEDYCELHGMRCPFQGKYVKIKF